MVQQQTDTAFWVTGASQKEAEQAAVDSFRTVHGSLGRVVATLQVQSGWLVGVDRFDGSRRQVR